MSYVKPIDYSKQINALLSEGLDHKGIDTPTGMVTEPTVITARDAVGYLNTDDREQLLEYLQSLKEIKKQIGMLIKKGKAGAMQEKIKEDTGGDMMHMTMSTEEE